MRRFLVLVAVIGGATLMAFNTWPPLGDAYYALWSRHISVNAGGVVTGLSLLALLVLALWMGQWRSRRDLARIRRSLI
jgi:fumarate reductase subunit D